MLLNQRQLMVTALLCSAALSCRADDSQPIPQYETTPAPQNVVVQPPAPEPEPEGLWSVGRREKERRQNPNQTVRGRAKLYEQTEPKPRIKLGDTPQ